MIRATANLSTKQCIHIHVFIRKKQNSEECRHSNVTLCAIFSTCIMWLFNQFYKQKYLWLVNLCLDMSEKRFSSSQRKHFCAYSSLIQRIENYNNNTIEFVNSLTLYDKIVWRSRPQFSLLSFRFFYLKKIR